MSTTLLSLRMELDSARRAKEPTSFFSFVIAECEKVGKREGNRESTEDEVQSVIKKLIASNEIVISQRKLAPVAKAENEFLQSLRPQMVSEEELRAYIANTPGPIGNIMGAVKREFGARADMKLASQIAREN